VLLKLPPYLSAIFVVVGVVWLLLLPLNDYSRQTYVSENAILPGQVHTYFGGSEHNVFRAFRQEVYDYRDWSDAERNTGIGRIMRESGLKVAEQTYTYRAAGEDITGTNVYGILQGPRADATEAMVLMAGWKNFEGLVNYSGVALVLTLARYFARWSIWSKDIIVIISPESTYGPIAWVDAYHSTAPIMTATRNVSTLPIKGGALQAAIAIDYPIGPWGHRFDKIDIQYDGLNGALPNLDLLNTAVSVASGQMHIGCSLHGITDHKDSYTDRLRTLAAGLATQSLGHATGPHSAFMPYHIDAITLKTMGDGWHDEMSLGRVTESLVRSINNLLEHLHQSFFFYILLNANRFVSIGNYLPAAMLIAGSFTVSALALWVQSGRGALPKTTPAQSTGEKDGKLPEMELVRDGKDVALVPKISLEAVERQLFLPALTLLGVHLASSIPLYLLTKLSRNVRQTIPSATTLIYLY
jgi:glycosylphosphatidylinositol transamidase